MPRIVACEKLDFLLWGAYRTESAHLCPIDESVGLFSRECASDLDGNFNSFFGKVNQVFRVRAFGFRVNSNDPGILVDGLRCTVLNFFYQDSPLFAFACGAFFPGGLGLNENGKLSDQLSLWELDPRFGDGFAAYYPLSRSITLRSDITFDVNLSVLPPLLDRIKEIEEDPRGRWLELVCYLYGRRVREVV